MYATLEPNVIAERTSNDRWPCIPWCGCDPSYVPVHDTSASEAPDAWSDLDANLPNHSVFQDQLETPASVRYAVAVLGGAGGGEGGGEGG